MISRIFSSGAQTSTVALDSVAIAFQDWLGRNPDAKIVAMSHHCVNTHGMPGDHWFTASILIVYTLV